MGQRAPKIALSPDRDDFVYERRQTSRHEEIREIIDEINVSGDQPGLESMRYPPLERRIQKAFSTSPAYTVPLLLGLSPSHSPSLLLSL